MRKNKFSILYFHCLHSIRDLFSFRWYVTIFELWCHNSEKSITLLFYPSHIRHLHLFSCYTNGAVKGKDRCFDFNLDFLGFSFSYTNWNYR